MSLILPFDVNLVDSRHDLTAAGWTTARWTFAGLQDRTAFFDRIDPQNFKREEWFTSEQFDKALEEVQYHCLPKGHSEFTDLDEVGVVVKCVERRVYEDIGFIVVHMVLDGRKAPLRDPDAVVRALRRPNSKAELQNSEGEGVGLSKPVLTTLRAIVSRCGLVVPNGSEDATVGISRGGVLTVVEAGGKASTQEHLKRAPYRPFLITHLAPVHAVTQRPAKALHLDQWGPVQAWALAMSSGVGAGRSMLTEANTTDASVQCSGWLDRTYVRASRDGIAFVSTEAARKDDERNARIRVFSHGPVVDLAILALRQRKVLLRQAEELTEASRFWKVDASEEGAADEVLRTAAEVLRRALALDAAFVQFRNTGWLTSVPGRPEGTKVLRLMQDGLGTEELVSEVVEKQADLTRVLDLAASVRERNIQERRERLNVTLGILAAVFGLAALVLGGAALFAEPSPRLLGGAVKLVACISAVGALTAACAWAFGARRRRKQRG